MGCARTPPETGNGPVVSDRPVHDPRLSDNPNVALPRSGRWRRTLVGHRPAMFFVEGHRTPVTMPTHNPRVSRHYGGQIRHFRSSWTIRVPRARGYRPGSAACNVHRVGDTRGTGRSAEVSGAIGPRHRGRGRADDADRGPTPATRCAARRRPLHDRLLRPRRPGAAARPRPLRAPRGWARRRPPGRRPPRRARPRAPELRDDPSVRTHQRGMFPCFLGGSVARLPRRARRALMTETRVACGWMMPSSSPRSAARYGDATL